MPYSPEGVNATPPTLEDLRRSAGTGDIFQARCTKCDEYHNLHLDLPDTQAIIPRDEAALGIREGRTKEIAILSRVGKWVCFQVFKIRRIEQKDVALFYWQQCINIL